MYIAIFTLNERQSEKWRTALQQELPDTRIEIYPDIKDFNSVTFLVCWKPPIDIIGHFPNLKAIQSLGAGVDHILDRLKVPEDIQVSKVVDENLTKDMWQHALSLIMSDMKNIYFYWKEQSSKRWSPRRYKRIKEVTVGILGLGTIGSYVAEQFASIGFETLGWSSSNKNISMVQDFIGPKGLDILLEKSDYVVNILPLTDDTRGMFDQHFFSKMKKDAYFINIGRGPLVVDKDLIEAIDNRKIRGAALDVFHKEPIAHNHDFWDQKEIFITPHIASLTHISSVYPSGR